MIANGKENETRAKSNHVMQDTEAAAHFAWYFKKKQDFLKILMYCNTYDEHGFW